MSPAHILQLPRRPVWLTGIKNQLAFKPHYTPNRFGKLSNCDIFTSAKIYKAGFGIIQQLSSNLFIR
jgi:hypothetical protein